MVYPFILRWFRKYIGLNDLNQEKTSHLGEHNRLRISGYRQGLSWFSSTQEEI